MKKTLTIYHLYPDLMDVYADHGNVTVLQKRLEWRGFEVNVRTLTMGQVPDFTDADIVLIGAGSAQAQKTVASMGDVLAAPLKTYAEDGGVVLAVGAGFELLGNTFENDGEILDGFGILDMNSRKAKTRMVGHFIAQADLGGEIVTLVGFEHHTCGMDIKSLSPFAKVVSGYGNGDTTDGAVYKNVIGTYMHGPILPKNPALADFLISAALMKKYNSATLAPLEDEMAQKARSVVLERGK